MNKKQLKSFAKGSAVSLVGAGILGIINYFIRRTLALNLSENDYGFIYSAFALVMPIIIFLDLGMTQSTTILLAKCFAKKDSREAGKIFSHAFYIKLTLAVVVFIILELSSPYITRYYMKYPGGNLPLMLILSLIISKSLEGIFFCVVTAKKSFSTQQLLRNISALIILIMVLTGARQYGLNYCIAAFVVGSIVTAIIAAPILTKKYELKIKPPSSLDRKMINEIFSISTWIAISAAGMSLMYYMDTACLTLLKGLEAVSMYNIALPIMQIAQSFFVFPAIFTPIVAEMHQKKDYAGIRKSCIIANLGMLLALPVLYLSAHFLERI